MKTLGYVRAFVSGNPRGITVLGMTQWVTAILVSISLRAACGPSGESRAEESRAREKAALVAKEQEESRRTQAEANKRRATEEQQRELREEQARTEERAKGGRDAVLRQAIQILAGAHYEPARRITARIDAIWSDLAHR